MGYAMARTPRKTKRLTASQQRLVLEHKRMAYKMANDARRRGWRADIEDLEGWALEGLCRAAMGFRAAAGWRFTTYAHPVILMAIVRGLRKAGPLSKAFQRRGIATYTPGTAIGGDEGPPTCVDRIEAREAAPGDGRTQEAAEQLEPLLKRLGPTERILVRLRFGEGRSLRQIAELLDCRPENIRQRCKKALAELRRAARWTGTE